MALENKPNLKFREDLKKGALVVGAVGAGLLGAAPIVEASGLILRSNSNNYSVDDLGKGVFGITIDGGGSVVSTGTKGYLYAPYSGVINGWTILSDRIGSCVIDVKKCSFDNFPSTLSIAGIEKPTLINVQKNQSVSLTSWSTNIVAGEVIEFVVESASLVTRINLGVSVKKSQ